MSQTKRTIVKIATVTDTTRVADQASSRPGQETFFISPSVSISRSASQGRFRNQEVKIQPAAPTASRR